MMGSYTKSILLGLCLSCGGGSMLLAQGGGNGGGGTASQPDPIAIAVAHIIKGQTNAEQRKLVRRHYLTLAAERVEEVLRTAAFRDIIAFVERNRDLFVRIYAAMQRARGSMATLEDRKSVV